MLGKQTDNSMPEAVNKQEQGMTVVRLAILMTCHNRVAGATQCIGKLKAQKIEKVQLNIFLVDDGSTDGTADAIRQQFPDTTILTGDGNLYWCGGTRLAFSRAMQDDFDFYLWLNDDTFLYPDALQRLLATYYEVAKETGNALIVVGSTRDSETGSFTYGGWRHRNGMLGSNSWEKIPPETNRPIFCDTINGNCVLIPRDVVRRIGNLDMVFTHGIGDLDYGLRAKRKGCQIVISPGYAGECKANDGSGLWTDRNLSDQLRWKKLIGPKGLPIKEWGVFCRRHRGILWPLVWLSPYIRFWVRALLPYKKDAR